jgi:hypothetical protein
MLTFAVYSTLLDGGADSIEVEPRTHPSDSAAAHIYA